MLTQTIGELLPSAIAVALSPIPIIAVVLMLGTQKARVTGPAFAIGWILGLVAVSAIVLVLAGGADDPNSAASTGVDWFQVAVGVLFLVMALRQWRKRPRKGETPEMPGWMSAFDHVSAGKAFGLGILLSALNPKNLVLTAAGAGVIAQAGLSGGDTVIAVAVFVAIGSLTVAGSVLVYVISPHAAGKPLAAMKEFMSEHNAVIMMVLLLVLGAKILGQGLGGVAG